MGNIPKEKIVAWARQLYVEHQLSPEAVAEETEQSVRTIQRWKKGLKGEKDWDTQRQEFLSSPYRIRQLLMQEMEKAANGEKLAVNADGLLKLARVMESISGKIPLQTVITVLKELDNWTASQEPELAIKFLEVHRAFIRHRAESE